MPGRAGFVIYYQWMVAAVCALVAAQKPVTVPLHLGVKNALRDAAVASVARKYYRAPRDARVRFGVTAIRRIRAKMGRALDRALVVRRLERELRHPTTGRVVEGRVVHVRPAVTTAGLRNRYPAYISVDRGTRCACSARCAWCAPTPSRSAPPASKRRPGFAMSSTRTRTRPGPR